MIRGCLAAADFGVDFADVEDVDVEARPVIEPGHVGLDRRSAAHAAAAFVVVAGDDLRRLDGELGDALKDVLGRVRA